MISLGIDIGTSGIRAVMLDKQQHILAQSLIKHEFVTTASLQEKMFAKRQQRKIHWPRTHIVSQSQKPVHWWDSFEKVIFKLKQELSTSNHLSLSCISHLAIDGTSGTVLLADQDGLPCSEALMYHDQRAHQYAQIIDSYAPKNTAARGAASGLAKLLWLYNNQQKNRPNSRPAYYALNQSDWITGKLTQTFGFSDYNNALKMGYDAQLKCWPDWLITLLNKQAFPVSLLPEVFCPGEVIAKVDSKMAQYFGFSKTLQVCAGTTDSTAAIIASGAKDIGEAITSLGSTLVMKIITDKAIFDPQSGVYSQPYGDHWLAGGGSNSGGAVLKHFFSSRQLAQLTDVLNSAIAGNDFSLLDLDYYPLLSAGERFPIQDHLLEPRITPRPEQDIAFFQALLEGMADIESMAYQRLLELGAPYPKHVKSIGGGALNQAWQNIRQSKLGIPVQTAVLQQAAAGSAILAQNTW
ncbi:MAG: FGGY-family carbohydrate kinase [gamma proteobacterium symbiont of Taylorina sp.]|nr:FGGY-family carbohydrate kinase [gamma proteobacterium symbiont of Taylorina sp.]